MGKHVETPSAGKKRLWVILAVLAVLICWALWFFLQAPDQHANVGQDQQADAPSSQQEDDPSSDVPAGDAPSNRTNAGDREMKPGWYTILLAGTTDDYNTDTIMLCSVDTANNKVQLISINRDTQIDVDSNNMKINACYGRGGVEETCRAVTEITGVPINYYALVRMDAFKMLVDQIGGIEYDIPFDMRHKDLDPDFDINLKAGLQTMDGRQALQFVRFRSTSENDFGRVNRQKDFLIAALKQVKAKFSITQIKDYISIFNENVDTNMNVQEMVWFYLNVANQMNLEEDISSGTLPYATTGYYRAPKGKVDVAYVYLDPEQVVEFVNENLNPFTEDLTVDDVHIIHRENP